MCEALNFAIGVDEVDLKRFWRAWWWKAFLQAGEPAF